MNVQRIRTFVFSALLDAANIAAGPLAVVPLPFRVPLGLHGNWFGSQRGGGM